MERPRGEVNESTKQQKQVANGPEDGGDIYPENMGVSPTNVALQPREDHAVHVAVYIGRVIIPKLARSQNCTGPPNEENSMSSVCTVVTNL